MPLTKREAAVITAYTGTLIGRASDAVEYIEEILDRKLILPLEFMSIETNVEIKEKSFADFVKIHAEIVP